MQNLLSVTAHFALKLLLDYGPKIKSSLSRVLKATVSQELRHLCCSCVEWIPMSWSFTWSQLISLFLMVVHAKLAQNVRLC